MVIAGRVARGRSFTGEELAALGDAVDAIDPSLVCVLFGDNAPATPYAPMSGELVIGISLGEKSAYAREPVSLESVPGALRKARSVPAATWAAIAAALPGGLGDEVAIHLGCFGEDVNASVLSGETEIARVSASSGRRAIVSPVGAGQARLRVERG